LARARVRHLLLLLAVCTLGCRSPCGLTITCDQCQVAPDGSFVVQPAETVQFYVVDTCPIQ
jgi:hypothetical protein